jgi:hypothetical protein
MSPSIYQIACYLGAIKLLKYDRFIVSEVTLSTIAYAVSINRLMWRVFGEVLRARHQTGTPGEVRLFWYRKSTRGRNRSRHDLYNPPMLRGDDGLDTPFKQQKGRPSRDGPCFGRHVHPAGDLPLRSQRCLCRTTAICNRNSSHRNSQRARSRPNNAHAIIHRVTSLTSPSANDVPATPAQPHDPLRLLPGCAGQPAPTNDPGPHPKGPLSRA